MVAMGMPDVFELTTASAPRHASTRSRSARLASSRSTIASTTQSQSAMAGRSASNPPRRMRARTSFVKNGSGLRAAACFSPRAAVSASRSSSSTGQPALATWAAIWAPMVPAPSTATERMVCITVSSRQENERTGRGRPIEERAVGGESRRAVNTRRDCARQSGPTADVRNPASTANGWQPVVKAPRCTAPGGRQRIAEAPA